MKLYQLLFFISFISLQATLLKVEKEGWTNVYKIKFTKEEQENNSHKKSIICQRSNVTAFTQMIFSWNALRPQKGKFTFYVQVKDKKTQKWDKWLKMVEWGNGIQQSFFDRGNHSLFNYARLEASGPLGADGFRIKIVASNDRDLSLIKYLVISLSDFNNFIPEPYVKRAQGLNSFMLKNVPQESQMILEHPKASVLCSPTSISMIIGSVTGNNIDPLICAKSVHDTGLDIYGNWSFNIAHAFEKSRGKALFYATRLKSFNSLYKLLKKQVPVAVSVRGPMKGAATPYDKGHILVVVGWDAKKRKVICHDPAFDSKDQVFTKYDIHDFIVAWERSRRLTYKTQLIV